MSSTCEKSAFISDKKIEVVGDVLPAYTKTVRASQRAERLERLQDYFGIAAKAVVVLVGVLFACIMTRDLLYPGYVEEVFVVDDPLAPMNGFGWPFNFGQPFGFDEPSSCPGGIHFDMCPGDALVVGGQDEQGEDMVILLEFDQSQVPGWPSNAVSHQADIDAAIPNILEAIFDKKQGELENIQMDAYQDLVVKPTKPQVNNLRDSDYQFRSGMGRKSMEMLNIPWLPTYF
jgi:hypothetical protein